MSIDLSQFHQVFFEESIDGLDSMESALVELDPASYDAEVLNSVFRAAHSIKGGAGTFGFMGICDFTHVLETLLDQIRANTRPLLAEHLTLLLESVDCLRELLAMAQAGVEQKSENSLRLQKAFEAILNHESSLPDESHGQVEGVAPDAQSWKVSFRPHANILQSGNDPLRICREIQTLGVCETICNVDSLPGFHQLDPESFHLNWHFTGLEGVVLDSIQEVFEWVAEEADITIEPVKAHEFTWLVHFAPDRDLFKTGNDPLKIISSLAQLGELSSIQSHGEELPQFSEYDPEVCYLAWDMSLQTAAVEAEVAKEFEWVADDCELVITAAGAKRDKTSEELSIDSAPVVATSQTATKTAENTFIRVSIDKIDLLINMVGELVITQSMLGQISNEVDISKLPRLMEGLSQLEQNTRELQDGVMRIRMLPISFAFNRFPRLVKDLGQKLNKKIALEISGEHTELDKTVMEKIGDPLVHLVRNAIDHGIESPEVRLAQGKSETGKIALDAYHKGGDVVIVIRDDGAGLNSERILEKALEKKLVTRDQAATLDQAQIFDLIFQPGFSTAKEVTDVSGRGVGMDVVRKNIQALNGTVEIHSQQGYGSTITIRLPLTLAILDGQLVRVGNSIYIFPLVSIVESMQCKQQFVNCLAGGQNVFRLREEYVPVIELASVFGIREESQNIDNALMVVVEADGVKAGLIVDELLSQQQVVIKSLENNYKKVEGVSGATILGDGTVALIVDVQNIVKLFNKKYSSSPVLNSTYFPGLGAAGSVRASNGM